MNRKKLLILSCALLALVLVVSVVLSLALKPPSSDNDSSKENPRNQKTIGICLPDESEPWAQTGTLLQTNLNNLGYQVTVVKGDGTAKTQDSLLQTLINKPVDCIITAPIDSAGLSAASSLAKQKGVPIISYGSLLMDTEATAAYICYDYYEMGIAIAQYIERKLSLPSAQQEEREYTVELFMGDPKDYNALQLHKGIMSVLEPYLKKSILRCSSNRLDFEDSCINGWSDTAAEKFCGARLSQNYRDQLPDVCICASDSIAMGVIRALEQKGATAQSMPLVTGSGATNEGKTAIKAGKLALTVVTEPSIPAKACCDMVENLLMDVSPPADISTTFNNVTDVPTAKCGFDLLDK